MEKINFPKPNLHLFVCVNERPQGHPTPSCGPRIKPQDVKEIKKWIVENGLSQQVYTTKTKCLGFCNSEGSVACVYPKGKFIKGIQNMKDLKKIIQNGLKELEH